MIDARQERDLIKGNYPAEYADGARRGFARDKLYPTGFHQWPLDRRNAWWAGFNKGYCDRRGRCDG